MLQITVIISMTSICVHMCVLYAVCVCVCMCVCVYMCTFMHVYIQGHSCKLAAQYSLDNAMITHMYEATYNPLQNG